MGEKKAYLGPWTLDYGFTFKPPQGTAETSSAEEDAPDTPTPTLAGRHTTLSEAMASWREKGFRRRHASSKTHVMLWCATNPAKPGSDHVPKCPATVHVRYVESTSPDDVPFWQSTQGDTHGDACCYHNWDGKVPSFGNWLGDGVREIILEAYFKTNALTNRPSTRPEHLAHIKEQYVDQRSNWALGDSPAGIPAATPSEPHAQMLKVVTDHRRSTLVEFLQVTLPKIAKQWTTLCLFWTCPTT